MVCVSPTALTVAISIFFRQTGFAYYSADLLIFAGFRSTRRTKIICTIGPKSSSTEMLATLAAGGMNVARLNMSHGDHEWHKTVINRIRKLNKDNGYVHAQTHMRSNV